MKSGSNLSRVFKTAFWLLIVLVFLLLIVAPLLTSVLVKAGQMPIRYVKMLRHVETAQFYLMQVFGVGWLFFLGSCFASFLNVVAWRTPRGRGVNGSSKCPFCNNKLRFGDNLPVIGWIRNGGQCRDCRLPISPRYLIVEIILGSLFLLICGVEILGGGMNLPMRAVESLKGFENLVFTPKWDLIQLASYHLNLICLLFTFALIRSEGLKVPFVILITGLIFGIALPLIWPAMLIVSWQWNSPELFDLSRFSSNQLITLGVGTACGVACGIALSWFNQRESQLLEQGTKVAQSKTVADGLASLVLVGIFLGWQSVISVTLISLVIGLLSKPLLAQRGLRRFNLSTRILVATLIHLLLWRVLTALEFWPSQSASLLVFAISIAACIAAGLATKILDNRWIQTSNPDEPQL